MDVTVDKSAELDKILKSKTSVAKFRFDTTENELSEVENLS